MSTQLYFENVKTKKRYLVVNLDSTKGEITLRGESSEFTEPYSKERMQRLGYTLVKAEPKAA